VKIAPERFASRRDTLAFIFCVVLSLSARLMPPTAQDVLSDAIRNVMIPAIWLQDQTQLTLEARPLVALLTAQRDSTALDSLQLYMLTEENSQLRELLSLAIRMPTRHVAAEVLHQASPVGEYTLLLSAGSDDGVVDMAPVIAPQGLVGVIRTVSASTSIAVVWTHPDFRVSAMTADGTVFGIAEPRGRAGPGTVLMELRGIPFREDVPIGSHVYTSGRGSHLGGAFPRGIPIGTVRALAEQSEGWSKTYVLSPAVQPASISHVIVLLGADDDIAPAFQPEDP
jgi:rod shape-determining protein MreC